jgi:phosphopantetheine adenylyltransferase/dephospho-CoA kinase
LTEFKDKDLVDGDGKINRIVLGKKVFGDPAKLETLQNIVWPEIWKLAQNQAHTLWQSGRHVVVLDAAVLIKAGWQKEMHQVCCRETFKQVLVQYIIRS